MRTTTLTAETVSESSRSLSRRPVIQILSTNRLTLVGALVVLFVSIMAIIAPFLPLSDPVAQNISERLSPPSGEHLLGTDEFGRDVLSRVIHGSRISLQVGIITTVLAFLAGGVIGLVSGYFTGYLDSILMRLMDSMMSVPGILLAIGIVAVLGAGVMNITLALAIVYTPRMARVVRSVAITLRGREFVEASRASGARHLHILWFHILPNAYGLAIVQATIIFAYAVLAEASLSFLGLGAAPPAPSWGNILSDGRGFLYGASWIAIFPGLAISLTILGINLLGDGLRDVLDPRLR